MHLQHENHARFKIISAIKIVMRYVMVFIAILAIAMHNFVNRTSLDTVVV